MVKSIFFATLLFSASAANAAPADSWCVADNARVNALAAVNVRMSIANRKLMNEINSLRAENESLKAEKLPASVVIGPPQAGVLAADEPKNAGILVAGSPTRKR